MHNKKIVSGTKGSITIENTWYEENTEDKSHVVTGIIFISLIVLAKLIMMF